MQRTNISWTDYTSNPIKFHDADGKSVWGCVKVSHGCEHCYAEALALRYGRGGPFDTKTQAQLTPYVDDKEIRSILRSKAPAGSLVFIGDMTDIFGEWVTDEMLDKVFAAMALRPDLHFQLLTKRVKRMRAYLADLEERVDAIGEAMEALTGRPVSGDAPDDSYDQLDDLPLPNVSLGITVCNQEEADRDTPELLATQAAVRYVSCEPQLAAVNWQRFISVADKDARCSRCGLSTFDLEPGDHSCPPGFGPALDMIIVGGESGPKARPFDIAWPRSTVAQCRAAGVAVHVKQMGSNAHRQCGDDPLGSCWDNSCRRMKLRSAHGSDMSEWPEDLRIRDPWPKGETS